MRRRLDSEMTENDLARNAAGVLVGKTCDTCWWKRGLSPDVVRCAAHRPSGRKKLLPECRCCSRWKRNPTLLKYDPQNVEVKLVRREGDKIVVDAAFKIAKPADFITIDFEVEKGGK